MFEVTVDAGAASRLFNLSAYRVVDVTRDERRHRTVVIATRVREAACPSCAVATSPGHQRMVQHLRDVPFDGQVGVVSVKRRCRCAEVACARSAFAEHTDQVPVRARMTTRLKDAVVVAVAAEARAVSGVAAAFGVSWASVHRQVRSAGAWLSAAWAARPKLVRWLGIDEHRFRSVCWFRDEAGAWRRLEPWSITFVDLSTGAVVGVVDGRDSAAVKGWLIAQPRWWRHRVSVVAIVPREREVPPPSAAFRSAVRHLLPKARVSVDHFHLVKLAGDALTGVRPRVSWERHDRRGRKVDPAWAHRLLLQHGYDTLSEHGKARLDHILATDDPTNQIGAAWGVKEQLRILLANPDKATARAARAEFNQYVTWAAMPETTRLKKTIDAWWPENETFITTRVTNARTEAANTTIKHIKRTGREFRTDDSYRCRITITSAARSATRSDLPQNHHTES